VAIDRSDTPPADRLRAPGLGLLLAEARGIFELNASLLLSPLLMRAPRGDGHPVLMLPGFLASDLSMAPMRRYLRELGYDSHAWEMGRNTGGISRMRAALRDRLAGIHAATGRKVVELLKASACRPDRAVIVVTHDSRIFDFADRIAEMEDGVVKKIHEAGEYRAHYV